MMSDVMIYQSMTSDVTLLKTKSFFALNDLDDMLLVKSFKTFDKSEPKNVI